MTIVTRTSKGAALTIAEMDGNFTDLDGRVTALEDAPGYVPTIAVDLSGSVLTLTIDGNDYLVTMPQATYVPPATVTVTGTTLTIGGANLRKVNRFTNAAGCAITFPANATTPIGTEEEIEFVQAGAGALTFVAAGGVTINKPASLASGTTEQWQRIKARKVATNEWDIG